jgi:nucleoid-associated protein YgaU
VNIAQTIQARSLGIADSLDTLATKARAAATRDALLAVASDASAVMGGIGQIRSRLDALAVGQTYTVARDLMDAGLWERSTRSALVASMATAMKIRDTASRIAGRTPSRVRRHVVKAGETPQSIARMELGDWQRWMDILIANQFDPADNLTVGDTLVIPGGIG